MTLKLFFALSSVFNLVLFPMHDMGIDATVAGRSVTIEVFYEDGSGAADANWEVVDKNQVKIATGKTDATGHWTFEVPTDGDFQVTVEDGNGHSTWTNFTVGEEPKEDSTRSKDVEIVPALSDANRTRSNSVVAALGLLMAAGATAIFVWRKRSRKGTSDAENRRGGHTVSLLWFAALVGFNNSATAQSERTQERLSSTAEVIWDEDAARHLLSRTCFGGTPEQARELARMPMDDAIQQLLNRSAAATAPEQPDWVRDVWVNSLRRYADMPREEYLVMFRRASSRNDAELLDLRARWVQHMVRTPDPFRENLTLFWHGHFTSASSKMFAVTQAFQQQNATWRQHAMGNFREFLEAVTLDPGMLIYLDMEGSTKENPNENYARELLELFSLGVGNYTETDIREVARALTGWTLDAPPGTIKPDRPTNPETAKSLVRDGLIPTFVADRHDAGIKTVFGKSGPFAMKEVLDLIAEQPACGQHVAASLLRYFGVEDPDHELRDRMAIAFRESHCEIRPMLHIMLTSRQFYSPGIRGNRVKSPVRLLIGACRDLQLEGEIHPSVAQATVPLGQELFNPPTVKGWPVDTDWITSTTLALRYRLPEVMLDGKNLTDVRPLGRPRGTLIPRDPAEGEKLIQRLLALDEEKRQATTQSAEPLHFSASKLVEPEIADSPEQLADTILKRLLVVPARSATREAIVGELHSARPEDRVLLAVRLILATPEYQME